MLWLKTRKTFNNFSQQRSFLASAQRIGGNGVQGWSQNFIFEKVKNTTRWKMLKKRHRRKGKLIVIIQYILSGDLLRLLHDWGAAPWLSRVCLDFVQDKGRVGRVEQVKSWGSWAPFRILSTLFQPRQVDQVDLLVFVLLFDNMSNIFKQNASTKCTLAFKDLSC